MGLLSLDFTAQDDGLTKQLKGFREDFKGLGKEILQLQRIQTFLAAISLDKLDDLNNKIHSIATSGMNLTSSLESTFQQMDISSRKMGVNLGKTAEEIRKFSKDNAALAMSLGISADEAGKANAAFEYLGQNEELGKAFREFGITSAKEMAKFASASGMDMYEFTYGLNQMQKQLGLTGEGITGILGSLQQYGRETGDVSGAMKKMTEMQDLLAKHKSVFKGDAAAMAKYASGMVNLGLAFQKGGVKDGFEMSKGLAEKLAETGGDFSKLISGVGSELPSLITDLGVTGLNTEQIFASMKQGPQAFMAEIGKVTEAAQAQGKDIKPALDFIKNRLSNTLGEPFAQELARVMGDEKSRKAMMGALDPKAMQAVEEAGKKALKETKDAFRDSRTAAELYDLQLQGFEQRFRNLSTTTQGEFLKGTRKGFNEFGSVLEHVASQGGPMGMLVGKMADVTKFGAAGLLPPDMAAQFNTFGAAAEKLAGPLAKLKSLGLLSPFGALAAIVGILGSRFISLYAQTKDAGKALEGVGLEVLDFVKNKLPAFIGKGVKAVGDAARNLLAGGFRMGATATNLASIGGQIVDAIVDGLKATWNFVTDTAKGLWAGLFGNRGMVDVNKDGQAIGLLLGETLKKAFISAKNFIVNYLVGWWADMQALIADPSKTVGEKIGEGFLKSIPIIIGLVVAAGPLIKAFMLVWRTISIVITVVGKFISIIQTVWTVLSTLWTVLEAIWTAFEFVISIVTGTTGAVATLIAVVVALTIGFMYFPNATQKAVDAVSSFASIAGKMLGKLVTYVMLLPVYLVGLFLSLPKILANAISSMYGLIAKIAPALASALVGLLDILKNLVSGMLDGIRDTLASQFPAAAGPIFAVFDTIKTVWNTIVGGIQLGLTVIGEVISTVAYFFQRLWGTIGLLFEAGWAIISGWLTSLYNGFMNILTSVGGFFSDLWASIYSAGQPFFDWIAGAFGWLRDNVLTPIGNAFLSFYDMVVTNLRDSIAKVKDAFGFFKDMIGGFFDKIDEKLKSIISSRAAPAAPAAAAAGAPPAAPAGAAPAAAAMPAPAAAGAAPAPAVAAAGGPPRPAAPAAAARPRRGAMPALAAPARAGLPAGLPAGIGGAGAMPALPAGLGLGAGAPAGAGGFGIPAAAGVGAAPPPVVAPADITSLVNATNNPAWVPGFIALQRQMHADMMTALGNLAGGGGGGGGGARAPGRPRPIAPAVVPPVGP